jgi:hypothetical protein
MESVTLYKATEVGTVEGPKGVSDIMSLSSTTVFLTQDLEGPNSIRRKYYYLQVRISGYRPLKSES